MRADAPPWALPRVDAPEWLDQGRGQPADVAANLTEMWRLNRYLGGLSALTRHLYPRLQQHPGRATLLDLGTGSAEIPRAIAQWAAEQGRPLTITAVDWAARNLAVARTTIKSTSSIQLLQADALRLPLAPRSVDYVLATLFLHHFAPAAAVELLRAAYALARRALIVSDLVRGRLPLLAFGLARPLLARHPFTWHDGVISIRRAYTPAELRVLAVEAGLPNPCVYAHWPWRMTLVAERADHA